MEDLYTNLDDYEEVNAIDELRNENKNLKLKVDEYAIAMENLQKDFDILSSEFKRLEINYSSLLKTARAEVERKTQIITNLNMEKDMLVLNSIQNGNNNLLRIRRNMTINKKTPNKTKNSSKHNDSDDNKSNKNSSREIKENSAKLKDFSSERLEEIVRPSVDTARNSLTDSSKLVNKLTENVESCSDRNSYAKENNIHHKDGYEGSVSAQSGSIKHRRKSMLALSAQDEKFSTDEEWDTVFIAKEPSSKEYSSKKEYSNNTIERDINNKQNRKHADPSNIDDKYYGSHESSRDTRKSRNYRNHDVDKYRSQDKYSRKSWRHTSPDRSHRKSSGDAHTQRSGYRNRVLESPPLDKYSNYKRRTREHRMNFERYHPSNEYGTKRHYQTEKKTSKYKMSSDYGEPSNKRVRTNSFHRQADEDNTIIDNKRGRTNSYHLADEEDEWYDDINSIENDAFSEIFQGLRSCQSPDFLNSELQQESNHKCKEIKDTAAAQLDDPRMTSKKYVVKSDDNKVTMCTAVGRNVDIEPIDKDKWNIPRVHVPELLVHKPVEVQRTEIDENLVKEIYMDIEIENPVSNLSLESGEIYFGSERDINSVTKELDHKDVENGISCAEIINNTQELNQKAVLTANYRIPKIKHCVQEPNSGDSDSSCPFKPKSSEINKDHNEKNNTKDFKKRHEMLDHHDNFLTKNINYTKHDVNQQDRQENYTISSRQIVEGDLELSDEASDNIDLHQFTRKYKRIFRDTKHGKSDNTVKDINSENIESLSNEKDIQVVEKNPKTIPKKQHHSSIFDIQNVDENKEKTDTNKSKEILIVDESQKSNNENQLSMMNIQPPEMEIKEKVNKNKEKMLPDKNQKTHEKDGPKEEADSKGKEMIIVDKNQKTNRSKPNFSKHDVQHNVDDKKNRLEIKNPFNNQTTYHMNEPECTLIEIKERANTNKNEKIDDTFRKSNHNKEDAIAKLDIQLSAEEIKDTIGINSVMKICNIHCNQKQEDQSMIDIQITEEDNNVKNKHPTSLITLQHRGKEIKDKCDKNKEMQLSDQNEAIDHSQKYPSKKDNKTVMDIDEKLNKKMEIKEAEIIQKIAKNIEITIVEKEKSEPLKQKSKKSQKLKETQKKESSKDTESLQVNVKRRSKKEKDKPKEIKNKFTDLFGDSCSLITPEELGINSAPIETVVQSSNNYLPIFEDAQDAIDLKEIAKVQLPTLVVHVALDEKSSSSNMQNSIACIDVDSQKKNEVKRVSGEIAKVNPNVNLESSPKETDVVKAVTISTGIQPGSLENNDKPEISHEIVDIDANTQTNYNVMLKSREFSWKAMASSTPHKDVHDKVLQSESKVSCIDSFHVSEQSDTNTLDSQTDLDVPDVRIFVRRRRKVIKKPTT